MDYNYGGYPPNGGYSSHNGTPPNGVYGQPYGQPYSPYQQPYDRYRQMKYREKKEIKTFSRVAGGCVIAYVAVQEVISLIVSVVPAFRSAYTDSSAFQCAFGILFSIAGVLLPFLLGAVYLKKNNGVEALRLEKPNSAADTTLLVFASFALCLVANYVTNILIYRVENMGFELSGGEYDDPTDLLGKIFYFLMIAVVPPLCEEVAVRGVVMMPLRKYGDRFAVIASAFVFAIMHGNLVQAPFAFIVGLALGYAVCKTNSLWTGIFIHFANNAFSAVMELMVMQIKDQGTQTVIYYAIIGASLLVGALCLIAYLARNRSRALLSKHMGALTSGEKGGAYVLTVPMGIAVIIMLFITSRYVRYTGMY